MKTHPVADLFPMLADDELNDLAADIAERGLLQPIVLDDRDRILDGRNRFAACEVAGIEPQFTIYDGDDPDGYALAVNIARRHLNKGQIAIVAARAIGSFSTTSKRKLAKTVGVNDAYISNAKTVLEHTPQLADRVLSGEMPLSEAYKEAQQQKNKLNSRDQRLTKIKQQAPDLAKMIKDDGMSLDEAEAAYIARTNSAKVAVRTLHRDIQAAVDLGRQLGVTRLDGPLMLGHANGEALPTPEAIDQAREALDHARAQLDQIEQHIKEATSNA